MSRTINCDVCGKVPSPMVNANIAEAPVQLRAICFTVTFMTSAGLDLCHECRNEALALLAAQFPVRQREDEK